MCQHSWEYEQTRRGKRAGMRMDVERFVCRSCNKRKYRPHFSYVVVAGLLAEKRKLDADKIDGLERQLSALRAQLAEQDLFYTDELDKARARAHEGYRLVASTVYGEYGA